MKALTPRQQQILDMIASYIEKRGFPPTRAEICEALGFKSPNAAEEHLKALVKKGAISMVPGASRGIKLSSSPEKSQKGIYGHLSLPLIGRVAAGAPILAAEHVEEEFNIDPSLFSIKPDYLLRVKGMSMKDAGIMEDDLIAVKKTQEIKNGDIVIARIEDEVTVKYFQRSAPNIVHLKPANEEFSDIEVNLEETELYIEGKSVGLIREN